MADDENEAEEITSICQGLNINIGTLNQRTIGAMLRAGKKSNELGHPVLLDPVGAGASKLRTQTALRLIEEVRFTVIKGNISEIKTLALGSSTTKGVDADVADIVTEENLDQVIAFAREFSKQTGAVIVITGVIDLVVNDKQAFIIRNGHAMMAKVTGTGCMLGAMMTAYLAANKEEPARAAAAAVCAMGTAGERAYEIMSAGRPHEGNASYRNHIIDEIFNMDGKILEESAKYELR